MHPICIQRETTNILMFGGEYYDGRADKMRVYNDLFLFNTAKCTWTQITSPQGCAAFNNLIHQWLKTADMPAWTCLVFRRTWEVCHWLRELCMPGVARFLLQACSPERSPGSIQQGLPVCVWRRADVPKPGAHCAGGCVYHVSAILSTHLSQHTPQ